MAGRFDGSGWREIPFPRTVIHPQFHPLEPEWIEFAGDPAPRMHRVRRDGSGMECLYEHGNDEFMVHETFLGRRATWCSRCGRERCGGWTGRRARYATIVEYNAWHIAPDRGGERVLCDTNHPDEGLQIVDVATGARQQACLAGRATRARSGGSALCRGRGFRGRAENLSWMENAGDTVYGPQHTHPHPSWSFEEDQVAFASDRTGVTQVYVVSV